MVPSLSSQHIFGDTACTSSSFTFQLPPSNSFDFCQNDSRVAVCTRDVGYASMMPSAECSHRTHSHVRNRMAHLRIAFRPSPENAVSSSIPPLKSHDASEVQRITYRPTHFRPSTIIIWYPSLVLTSPNFGAPVVLGSRSYATFSKSCIKLPRTFQPRLPPGTTCKLIASKTLFLLRNL